MVMGKTLLHIARWIAIWLFAPLSLGYTTAYAAGSVPDEPKTAAVVEFSVRGDLPGHTGAVFADLMSLALANTRYFILKDRLSLGAVAKIAKAQELGSTGLLDPKTAAELGKQFNLDVVVVGEVSKLGNRVNVTARLIDTRTAALLRGGQIQGESLDRMQIDVYRLAEMIIAPPEKSRRYAFTIKTEPTDAQIRLLNTSMNYQPGMRLAAGNYVVEVTRTGYVPRTQSVKIEDRDTTATVTLEKAKYGLTVKTEPADAKVQLLNTQTVYRPGVRLLPGDYEVEVSGAGYESRKQAVKVGNRDATVVVILEKAKYSLTVKTEPADANVRLLNTAISYQPDVRLVAGEYILEITRKGYVPRTQSVKIENRDTTVAITLERSKYSLTIRPQPADAQVRLVDSQTVYRHGVVLEPGRYQIEISREGYLSRTFPVQIVDSNVSVPVSLEKQAAPAAVEQRLTVYVNPSQAKVRLLESKIPYQPGVRLPPGEYEIEVTLEGYQSRKFPVTIAQSDLTIPVRLRKIEEKPDHFGLTVQSNPPGAQVRLKDSRTTYKPGVQLAPGRYTVEVSSASYESAQVVVQIVDSDVTVPVILEKKLEPKPKPEEYQLTVQANPADAQIRLLGIKPVYRPGISLSPGSYTVEVSRSGYETQRLTVKLTEGDVTMPVALEKIPEAKEYRLTVQATPSNARIRLLGIRPVYRPGISLSPGRYTVEVSRTGYETKRLTVWLTDEDVTVPVALEKKPEPKVYRLTVRADPSDAQIRLRGIRTRYRPGVELSPGKYTVEVLRSGYETKRLTVRLTDEDVTVPVALEKKPEPKEYRLTVRADPSDAQIRLRGIRTRYRSGVELPPGKYTVEVSRSGYETRQLIVRISNDDVTVPVTLEKKPEPKVYRLTVRADPSDARIRLRGIRTAYRPGVELSPGKYTVEVSRSGYETQRLTVRLTDSDVTKSVKLERIAVAPPSTPALTTTRPGVWRVGSVNIDGWMSGADQSEVQRMLNGYVGREITRKTLLQGAMKVYRSTGITLSFVVNTKSGALTARVAKRVRSTYESTVPLLTPSQFQRSGFGVTVR